MISIWESSWNEFVPFLEFPVELRKIVYATHSIESLNARFRRAVATAVTSPTNRPR
jgi:transposase-like protein